MDSRNNKHNVWTLQAIHSEFRNKKIGGCGLKSCSPPTSMEKGTFTSGMLTIGKP